MISRSLLATLEDYLDLDNVVIVVDFPKSPVYWMPPPSSYCPRVGLPIQTMHVMTATRYVLTEPHQIVGTDHPITPATSVLYDCKLTSTNIIPYIIAN